MSPEERLLVTLPDETAQLEFGARLLRATLPGSCVYLLGDLGAGKTTLARGAAAALGYEGIVVSPTYSLLETYSAVAGQVGAVEPRSPGVAPSMSAVIAAPRQLCHMDLYRLRDLEELELMGARDYFDGSWDCWIEWPDRGAGWLPPADLLVEITQATGQGAGEVGRGVSCRANSLGGLEALGRLRP